MTTKAKISNEIKNKIGISVSDSREILDKFLKVIAINAKTNKVKLLFTNNYSP